MHDQSIDKSVFAQNQGYSDGGGGFYTSPQFARGLLGASKAIWNSGYGGNPAMGFIGFGEGLQNERAQQVQNAYRQMQMNNVLRGGATGVLVDRMRQDPDFARQFYNMRGASRDLAMDNSGQVNPIAGSVGARRDLKYGERSGTKAADLQYEPQILEQRKKVEATYDPMIARGEADARNTSELVYEPQKKAAVDEAKVLTERKVGYQNAKNGLLGFERQADIVSSNINEALNIIDNDGIIPATGFGSYLSNVPNTDARRLENILTTIRANVGFDKLQAMRDASPTGGALGQVSDMENRLLQATSGALDAKDPETLKQNLMRIKELTELTKADRQRAFQIDYGKVAPASGEYTPAPLGSQSQSPRRLKYNPQTGTLE